MRSVHMIAGLLALVVLATACARPAPGPDPEPPSSSQSGTPQPTASDPSKAGNQGNAANPGSTVNPSSQTTPANPGTSDSAGGTKPASPPNTTNPSGASPSTTPTPPVRPKQAEVTVQYRYGDAWRTVSPLSSHLPPGAAELRLLFSKPVRQDEVEQALLAAQPAPIRGVLQWVDEHTLIWRITQMPPRIDFLLGEAHDKEGASLPGGLTSLRTGEAPALVMIDLADGAETKVSPLPPDILSADLTPDGKYLNLTVWRPGATRWDWVTTDRHLAFESQELKTGRVEGLQPRLPANLESWALSPAGNLVAGLRTSAQSGVRDLVVADAAGARQQTIPGFVARAPGAGTAGVVWSADGARVGALTQSPANPGLSDLVTFTLADRSTATLARDLPVPAGTAQLAWSPDGRHMLAGTLLLNLETGTRTQLPGTADTARGMWEPGGARLLYSAEDWGATILVDSATGDARELGKGLTVGWAGPGRIYLVRWPSSATRYLPLGQ